MPSTDNLAAHLSSLRSALAEAGEPLSPEDETAALSEGMAFLAALTPPAVAATDPAPPFGFNDLCRIDNIGVQVFVRSVPFEILALSLVGGPERIIHLFQHNLARRHAALLADDIAHLRETASLEAIAEARAHVVCTALRLASMVCLNA